MELISKLEVFATKTILLAMKFTLRPWIIDDLDSLVHAANNFKIANNLQDGFPYPYKEEDGREFIEMATSSEPLRIKAIDINGQAVGAIGIHPQTDVFHNNAEMGYWLAEPYWGKGIMTEAIRRMVDYGFNNFPINRIFARPYGSNLGSQRVLEKAGFHLEARLKGTIEKNGRVEDELIYAVRK